MSRGEARERFKRVAANRANRIVENLQILAHCGDRKNYEYDQEQVDKIFSAIETALATAKSKFIPKSVTPKKIEL